MEIISCFLVVNENSYLPSVLGPIKNDNQLSTFAILSLERRKVTPPHSPAVFNLFVPLGNICLESFRVTYFAYFSANF